MSRRTSCALGASGLSLLLRRWALDLKMLAPFLFLGARLNRGGSMKFLIVLLNCLMLSGCVSMTFNKPGMTQDEFNKDAYECKQQGLSASMNNVFIARDMEIECMKVRGYHQI